MTTGWCWFDLGQPTRAAAALEPRIGPDPAGAERARARYTARLALSLAGAGEPEQACAVAAPVLDACGRLDSATVRFDLCGLSRALNRWHALPEVRDTRVRLLAVLQDHRMRPLIHRHFGGLVAVVRPIGSGQPLSLAPVQRQGGGVPFSMRWGKGLAWSRIDLADG